MCMTASDDYDDPHSHCKLAVYYYFNIWKIKTIRKTYSQMKLQWETRNLFYKQYYFFEDRIIKCVRMCVIKYNNNIRGKFSKHHDKDREETNILRGLESSSFFVWLTYPSQMCVWTEESNVRIQYNKFINKKNSSTIEESIEI